MSGGLADGVVFYPVVGLPEFVTGDSIAEAIVRAVGQDQFRPGDIVVVTSKIVSKVEGCFHPAADRAALIARETVRRVAAIPDGRGSAIVENRLGVVAAAAGVDASNVLGDWVLALPEDPDVSARQIAAELQAATGLILGVVITDTAGRPWRLGQIDIAIGAANIEVFDDVRGATDTAGKPMSVTQRCLADEVASAADLVKGKVAGVPVAVVRGLSKHVFPGAAARARDIPRDLEHDLFALGTAEAIALGRAGGTAEGPR